MEQVKSEAKGERRRKRRKKRSAATGFRDWIGSVLEGSKQQKNVNL
jgi:hypothetical protein